MHGSGKIMNPDGTSFEGQFVNNQMHGEGIYTDKDNEIWEGIFLNNTFDSTIQKRLAAEKKEREMMNVIKVNVFQWFVEFFFVHGRSDKRTMKDNLTPFFATIDNVGEYVAEV